MIEHVCPSYRACHHNDNNVNLDHNNAIIVSLWSDAKVAIDRDMAYSIHRRKTESTGRVAKKMPKINVRRSNLRRHPDGEFNQIRCTIIFFDH